MLLLLLTLLVSSSNPSFGRSGIAASNVTLHGSASLGDRSATASVTPANVPYCRTLGTSINPLNSVCVSAVNNTPAIVPTAPNFNASVEPKCSLDMYLWIHSERDLTWTQNGGSPHQGVHSPLALNVTATLWNGDPFYSQYDDSTWHSAGPTVPWWVVPANAPINTTYPYTYQLVFKANSSTGQPNFYPGMTITWWIYFVNLSASNVYSHWHSASFTFTCSGAWAKSPYPLAYQYGGSNASAEDLNVSHNPLAPNWNDSVRVKIQTTSFDAVSGATIGKASLDVVATYPNGAPYHNLTLQFPVTVTNGTQGAYFSSVTIPPLFSQIAGVRVNYWITSFDTNPDEIDQIITQVYSYIVAGNGSFTSGQFGNDLVLYTFPTSVSLQGSPPPSVNPGQNVSLLLVSKIPGASILTAIVQYSFHYAALHEVVQQQLTFSRNNSTAMWATLPPFPMGSTLNFSVLAWDYTNGLDISPPYVFTTLTQAQMIPRILPSLTFFTVFVYDNGTGTWVSGATVRIQNPSAFVNSVGQSAFGISYPNQTFNPWLPLLIPANVSYNISISDARFQPTGTSSGTVYVHFLAAHQLVYFGTLRQEPDYVVIQEGASIYFYLNSTLAGPLFSPPNPSTVSIGAVLGVAGGFGALAITLPWWARIQERRKAEEKRVTL